MFTLYLHIPYCIVKCGYCDFHSLPVDRREIPHKAYAAAVIRQLQDAVARYELQGREIGAIFFGGGTPSLMEPEFFERVLQSVRKTFTVPPSIEITSEMNPATAKFDWLTAVREIGINRLSIGIQSFQPKFLKFLDRDHTADDVHHVMNDAKTAGFTNVSCDLIYAIPGQTIGEVEGDLRTALSFKPQHISAYQLTFEPGMPLTRRYDSGCHVPLLPKLSDESSLEQMHLVTLMLEAAGLTRYEISNFAQPGFESQHNLNYWRYGEYLGLGSGAVSCVKGRRWTTTRNVQRYLQGDFEPKDVDAIDLTTAMGEFCFLGLRTREGISTIAFEYRFGKKCTDVYDGALKKMMGLDLLVRQDDRITLTPRGIELSNEIFRQFVA